MKELLTRKVNNFSFFCLEYDNNTYERVEQFVIRSDIIVWVDQEEAEVEDEREYITFILQIQKDK